MQGLAVVRDGRAVYANPAEEQILAVASLDNLGKGASGAAVQNMDLMLAS
jgi:N-acetyl-gamma-glutamyl-phosphate reductase